MDKYLYDNWENESRLPVLSALGIGLVLGGIIYGLKKDYRNAVKVKQSSAGSATAARFQDPASREVLMWQAMMAQSARSTRVEAQ